MITQVKLSLLHWTFLSTPSRAPGCCSSGLQWFKNPFSLYLPLKGKIELLSALVSLTEPGTLNTEGSSENKSDSKAGMGILAQTLQLTKRNEGDVQVVDPVPGWGTPGQQPELLCSWALPPAARLHRIPAEFLHGTPGKCCWSCPVPWVPAEEPSTSPSTSHPDAHPQLSSCVLHTPLHPCRIWDLLNTVTRWQQRQLQAQPQAGVGHSGPAVATGQSGVTQPPAGDCSSPSQPLLTQRRGQK